MERWAANTLRSRGIILMAGLVLVGSLLLLLLSMCAANGDFGGNKHPEQVVPYLVAAGLVMVLGCLVIVRLARGIFRSMPVAEPGTAGVPPHSEPASPVPLHLSPLTRPPLDRPLPVRATVRPFSSVGCPPSPPASFFTPLSLSYSSRSSTASPPSSTASQDKPRTAIAISERSSAKSSIIPAYIHPGKTRLGSLSVD